MQGFYAYWAFWLQIIQIYQRFFLRQDEERLEVVEAKRRIEEERQTLEKELKKKEKMIQNQILGKSESNSRPRISFGMKKK